MLFCWEGLVRDYRTLHLSNCSDGITTPSPLPPSLPSFFRLCIRGEIWENLRRNQKNQGYCYSWVKSLCEVWRASYGNHIVNCYKWGFDNIGVTNGQFKGNWESLGDNRGNLGYWCYLWGLLSYVCTLPANRETIGPQILSIYIPLSQCPLISSSITFSSSSHSSALRRGRERKIFVSV